MKLHPKLAQSIVNKMMNQLPYNINMMDENGYIIASGDVTRINTLHVGALDAIKQRKTLTMADSHGENGRPGVNMPIFFNQDIIGVVGITGNPDDVFQFASLLKTTTELLIIQDNNNQVKSKSENELNRFLYQWAQIKDDINTHTDLLLDAHELNIDVLKERFAIAIRGPKMPLLPTDVDDYTVSMSDNLSVVLTYHQSTIDRCLKICKRKKLQIGIGKKNVSIGISINQAIKTLEIAQILKDKQYLYFDQIEFIYSLLSHNLSIQPLVTSLQTINQTEMGKEIIHTLLEFIEHNQNVNETSEALHVHRNTLNYRLNKIHQELGLDPHKLIDLFQLYVGYLYFSQDEANKI